MLLYIEVEGGTKEKVKAEERGGRGDGRMKAERLSEIQDRKESGKWVE